MNYMLLSSSLFFRASIFMFMSRNNTLGFMYISVGCLMLVVGLK